MNLYRIDTETDFELVIAHTRSKASWLVLQEWGQERGQDVHLGLDDPSFIRSRRLLLRDVEGPARIVDCDKERSLVGAGFAAIGKKVEWVVGRDYTLVFYDPNDRKCYGCGRINDLVYTDSAWECQDDEACWRGQVQQQAVRR